MQGIDIEATSTILSEIVEFELAGVVRFTHYALMVTGANRIPIVGYLKDQADESLAHAWKAGEILTGLGGHPSMGITRIEETNKHALIDILQESHNHETRAVELYRKLLDEVKDKSVYLEDYARSQIANEETQVLEFRKMLKDFG